MAKPCGCGGAGVTVRCRNGIKCSGVGSSVSPLVIEWEVPLASVACNAVMDCVGTNLGMGLRYNSSLHQIGVRISTDAGNQLVVGTDNGLFASGGGSTESGFATVDALVERTTPFAGGSYGGGFAMHPEGNIEPYRAGMAMELPLIHVPVRRTRDFFLVAQHHRDMGNYNPRFSGGTIDTYDLAMCKSQWYTPGGEPQAPDGNWGLPRYLPKAGYFGFSAPDSFGTPLLSDVFEMVQRRTVMYLECKDIGQSAGDTLNPIDTLRRIRAAIAQFGLGRSVIVGSEYPVTANIIALDQIILGLEEIHSDTVAIALHLSSEAMVDKVVTDITLDTLWTKGFRWIFVSYDIADRVPAKVKQFKDRGFHVVLFTGHRQWHWDLTNDAVRFGPGGLKGILCSDPVYCAGEINGYRYRQPIATWGWGTPDYGRHAYSGNFEYMRDRYRGYVREGQGDQIVLDGDVSTPADTDPTLRRTGYLILQGEQCPAPNFDLTTRTADNYQIDVGFIWEAVPSDRGRWMCVFFAVPEDRSITEWELATPSTRGYMFQLSMAGDFVIGRYDGAYPPVAPPTGGSVWASGWGNLTPLTRYDVRVQVRPTGITLGRADGGAQRVLTGDYASHWRGGYHYFGRHIWNAADAPNTRFYRGRITALTA